MANYIIIGGDQKEYGPVSSAEVRQWIVEGRLNEQSLVKAEGAAAFQPLGTIPEFTPVFAPAFAPGTIAYPPPLAEGDYDLDITGCISRGWEVVKARFWPAVGITAIGLLISGGVGQILGLFANPVVSQMWEARQVSAAGVTIVLLVNLASNLVSTLFLAGLMKYHLKLVRGETARVEDVFAGFGAQTGQLLLLSLVQGVLVVLGLLCCFIPGLYLYVAWSFAIPLIMDRELGFWDAMCLSMRMVNRHWFVVFVFQIVLGLLMMSGLLACCLGVFVTIPIGFASLMVAYTKIFRAETPPV